MKMLKFLALILGIITMLLAVIARLAMPDKALLGLASLSYLRLTGVLLLFALAFHFLFPDK